MDESRISEIIDIYEGKPDSLLQILLRIQKEDGWISGEVLKQVGRGVRPPLPAGRMQQIASFYKAFSLMPRGRHEVQVCIGTACYINGARDVLEAVQELLGIKPGETDMAGKFSLEAVNCLGHCEPGPVIVVDGRYYSRMTSAGAVAVLKNL